MNNLTQALDLILANQIQLMHSMRFIGRVPNSVDTQLREAVAATMIFRQKQGLIAATEGLEKINDQN